MDFFTFIIIAVFVYNIFSKKDKRPQRSQRSAEDNQIPPKPVTQMQGGKKKESIFENLERQIRESAESLERELQGGKAAPRKPMPAETSPRRKEYRTSTKTQKAKGYQETEGVWGNEGRSDYDKYVSTQGTQGSEGLRGKEGIRGQEGMGGQEGTWGTEGSHYASRQQRKASAIEQSEIGSGSFVPQRELATGTLGFSSSNIVQGIIWSEVLKEPRGKRGISRRR